MEEFMLEFAKIDPDDFWHDWADDKLKELLRQALASVVLEAAGRARPSVSAEPCRHCDIALNAYGAALLAFAKEIEDGK